jgi:hypothetical protein
VVVASYYCLFAVLGGTSAALALESLVAAAFVFVAIVGFRKNLWLVALALGSHGIFRFGPRPAHIQPGRAFLVAGLLP